MLQIKDLLSAPLVLRNCCAKQKPRPRRCFPLAVSGAALICILGCSALAHVRIDPSPFGQLLLVPVTVDGVEATFLLDTGATNSVLATRFAARLGLESQALPLNAHVETASSESVRDVHYVPIRSFRLGSVRAIQRSGEALIMDLSRIEEFAQTNIDGIVGNATLSSAAYVLDVRNRSLRIGRQLRSAELNQAARLTSAARRTYLPISINGQSFDFLLDTGSTRSYVSEQVLGQLGNVKIDQIELTGISLNASKTEVYERFEANVSLGQVSLPKFALLVGSTSRIGLDMLQHGKLSVSIHDSKFLFSDSARTIE